MKHFLIFLFSLHISMGFTQISFDTGNKEFDANLNIINNEGQSDFRSFKRGLSVDFNVPEPKIENMKVSLGMGPGEIYLSLEIARNSLSSLDDVLNVYQKNKSKGWGYIAKECGIKPGSPAFHQLKNNAKGRKDKAKGKPAHAKQKSIKKGKPHKMNKGKR